MSFKKSPKVNCSNDNIIKHLQLIREVSRATGYTIDSTREFFEALENLLFSHIVNANENSDVQIDLFNGVKLFGRYYPERECIGFKKGEIAKPKVEPEFYCSEYYRKRIRSVVQNKNE